MNKNNVIIITGPTASGKSGLAINLAKKVNGEIISCDCIQVYKELNIGSAKVTPEEMQGIPHYLINILEPNEEFNVSDFINLTDKYIKDILKRNKVPIIVGGTGLYIKALVEGYNLNAVEKDIEYRKYLKNILETNGNVYLYDMLKALDEDKAKSLNVNDTVRIIRALEVIKNGNKKVENKKLDYNFKIFAINFDRAILYDRINKRVDLMINAGLIDEVKYLKEKYNLTKESQSMKGIDYKETLDYLEGNISKETLIDLIKQKTRNYAKRQITFIKGINNVNYLNSDDNNKNLENILKELKWN